MRAYDYDRFEEREEVTETPPLSGAQDPQARQWAALCHASALLVFLGLPFGNLLGPLAVWLWKRNDYPFVDEQGKEALNFQISMTIYFLVSLVLVVVLVGFLLLALVALAELVLVVIASARAANGEPYRYPLTIRLIR